MIDDMTHIGAVSVLRILLPREASGMLQEIASCASENEIPPSGPTKKLKDFGFLSFDARSKIHFIGSCGSAS